MSPESVTAIEPGPIKKRVWGRLFLLRKYIMSGALSTKARGFYNPAWPFTDISRFVNKTVALRFKGRDLSFHLSHALFSSFDIDEGTRLLLKSIAQNVDLGAVRSVLDIGCGVGVIGAAVAARTASAAIVMQDRDALAAAFAAENCRLNHLEQVDVRCALAFHGLGDRTFDLVTSNLPAKAGKPVLHSFFRHAAGCLSAGGIAAVVIVAPLAPLARETLDALGCRIVHIEATRSYTVIHFGAGQAGPETDDAHARTCPRTSGHQPDFQPETAATACRLRTPCRISIRSAMRWSFPWASWRRQLRLLRSWSGTQARAIFRSACSRSMDERFLPSASPAGMAWSARSPR